MGCRLNGWSYPFKNKYEPFEQLELSVQKKLGVVRMAGAIRSKKIGSCFEWLELSVKKKLGAVRTAGAIPFKKVVSCLNWMFVANGWRYVLKP